jgi:N-acetylglutamate synthase/N-acetylornithine aminotransferase
VLVASTGGIGVLLDIAKVRRGIDDAVRGKGREGDADAARALHGRRHGQGLGRDRAQHGHHARRPHDRTGAASNAEATATVWTCDLSAEYVRIDADYRT